MTLTYKDAKQLHARARDKTAGKLIGNNTRIVQRGDAYAVRLHSTDIVLIYPDGSYTLHTGGWRTVTTKQRINEYAPVSVYSVRGQWHITTGSPDWTVDHPLFAEGVRITAEGQIEGAAAPGTAKAERKLRAAVAKYAADYTAQLYAGRIAKPSGGDCWGCYLVSQDGNKARSPMGGDHVRGHIKERYYVPSLVVRALDAFNASQAMRHDVGVLLGYAPEGTKCFPGDFVREQVQRAIRRWCLRELGMAA